MTTKQMDFFSSRLERNGRRARQEIFEVLVHELQSEADIGGLEPDPAHEVVISGSEEEELVEVDGAGRLHVRVALLAEVKGLEREFEPVAVHVVVYAGAARGFDDAAPYDQVVEALGYLGRELDLLGGRGGPAGRHLPGLLRSLAPRVVDYLEEVVLVALGLDPERKVALRVPRVKEVLAPVPDKGAEALGPLYDARDTK